MTDQMNTVPRRDRIALQKLQTAGFLSEAQTDYIARAISRSGQGEMALGFATAYFAMVGNAVPVNAAIEMAETLDARLNLTWSAARWKSEHDLLSRRVTLQRLAEVDIEYDLSTIEALVPKPVRGRLIRTSRRLGLEGFLQRHCVASYHEICEAGQCAIASVIMEGSRWTVELRAYAGMLRVLQVRGGFNAVPGDTLIAAIRERFGVKDDVNSRSPMMDYVGHQRTQDQLILETAPLFEALRAQNVSRVEVWFDGSGDSGSIGEVAYTPSDVDSSQSVRLLQRKRVFENGAWVWVQEIADQSINAAVEAFVYDFVELTGVDWYNNDGGFGSLIIDLSNGTVACDVNQRVSESYAAFDEHYSVETGARLEM